MKTTWLKLFTVIWLLCAAAISYVLLRPGLLGGAQQEESSEAPAGGQKTAELGWMRVVKQFDNVRRNFATSPDLSRLPAVQAITTAAAQDKVALQLTPLPPSGSRALRRAELRLTATGPRPALARLLQATEAQLHSDTLPLLGLDNWRLRSLGKQDRLELTLWTLVNQGKR